MRTKGQGALDAKTPSMGTSHSLRSATEASGDSKGLSEKRDAEDIAAHPDPHQDPPHACPSVQNLVPTQKSEGDRRMGALPESSLEESPVAAYSRDPPTVGWSRELVGLNLDQPIWWVEKVSACPRRSSGVFNKTTLSRPTNFGVWNI